MTLPRALAVGVSRHITMLDPRNHGFELHMDKGCFKWVKASKNDLNSLVSDHFGRSPYFLFVNLKKRKIVGHYFLKNPHKDKKVRAGLNASKLVVKQKSEVLITQEIGEISFHILRDNLVDVYFFAR